MNVWWQSERRDVIGVQSKHPSQILVYQPRTVEWKVASSYLFHVHGNKEYILDNNMVTSKTRFQAIHLMTNKIHKVYKKTAERGNVKKYRTDTEDGELSRKFMK